MIASYRACLPCLAGPTALLRCGSTQPSRNHFALLATFNTFFTSSSFFFVISHLHCSFCASPLEQSSNTSVHLRICLNDTLDDPLSSFLPHTPLAVYIHQLLPYFTSSARQTALDHSVLYNRSVLVAASSTTPHDIT
jgi:hypothetical protein